MENKKKIGIELSAPTMEERIKIIEEQVKKAKELYAIEEVRRLIKLLSKEALMKK